MNMSILGKFADTAKSLGLVLDNILEVMQDQKNIQAEQLTEQKKTNEILDNMAKIIEERQETDVA